MLAIKYLKKENTLTYNINKMSKIAILLTDFTLKKGADSFLQRYSEPYFVTFTLVGGEKSKEEMFPDKPMVYPNVRANGTISFAGDGHLLAEPKEPKGGYVFFSILFMESDSATRKLGEVLKKTVDTIWNESREVIKSNPKAYVAASIGNSALQSLAIAFSENSDDQLFRLTGTFLKSSIPSYNVNEIHRFANDWIDCGIIVKSFDSDEEYECFKMGPSYRNFVTLQMSDHEGDDAEDLVHKLAVHN